MDVEKYNREARLANFPPDERWAKVEGMVVQPRSTQPPLVSIGGRDHTGSVVKFWTDLPNAMHLLNMLARLQAESKAPVPSHPPAECGPFDGNL